MKGYTVLFIYVLTFAVGNNNVFGQVARNLFNSPLDKLTTVQTKCLEEGFGLNVFGSCMYERQLPWVAFGGGWQSTFRWSNTKLDTSLPGGVTVGLKLLKKDGSPSSGYEQNNRSTQGPTVGDAKWPLMPNESVESDFLFPRFYDVETKTSFPDPNTLAVGSIWLEYSTPEGPDALKGLIPSSLTFMSVDSSGAFHWNATEDEAPAAEYWVSQISETFDKSANWQSAKTTSAAISNPTESPIFVDIELRDKNGGFVAKTSLYLKVHETNAFLFRDLFGDQMFPGGHDFTGTVTFSRRENSPLNPGEFQGFNIVIFQVVGDSMGNLKVYPVKK